MQITLEPTDNDRLARLCGPFDEHLRQMERRLGVEIANRGNQFEITGPEKPVQAACCLLRSLFDATAHQEISPDQVHLALQDANIDHLLHETAESAPLIEIRTRHGIIRPRGINQQTYLRNVQNHDISFGIGPAGTGKTYLAVACAVSALERDEVRRLILARPAVEAGEKLGFLPGDLAQKVDPYLRPLYDALYEMLGFERVAKLMERNIIEVAPLAYMRGRTLNESFIILDEAQNTTPEQMKMFLTRIGFGSKAVVTGDVTQIDLQRTQKSGLVDALKILANVRGIAFTQFTSADVVRHPMVARIVDAYEAASPQTRSVLLKHALKK